MAAADTRQSILDTAEQLLGEAGFAGMSLRALTQKAGVNLAGVNYHFGSKEELTRAVLSRRIAPVNSERLHRLASVLDAHAPAAPPLAAVVTAFVAPALALAAEDPAPCAMIGRILAEQPPFLRAFLAEQFGDVLHRFAAAIVRAAPQLTHQEAGWRLHFTVGAMAHTMQHGPLLASMLGAQDDGDAMARRLIDFCVAGIEARSAPVPAAAPTPPRP